MEEIMAWRPTILLRDHEAIDVLMLLKLRGVKIRLDGESHTQVIQAIESFLSKYRRSAWSMLVADITGAIRRELLKSRNMIDAKLVREVVDYLKNGGVEKKKKKENGSDKGESDEEEEEDGEGLKDKDSSEDLESDGPSDEWDDEEDRYKGSDEEESDSGFEDEEDEAERRKPAAPKEEIDELEDAETRKECIEDLIELSKERGMIVKEGDEEEILNMMIPFIRDSSWYYHSIIVFLKRVREHIDRCSTLDNVETVEAALKNSLFQKEYDDCKIADQQTTVDEDVADAKDQVNHSLEKNMVPTKEEITTTMNQIHQEEKREYGDKMEIEEQETLIRLNQPEQAKESTCNAHSCIRESLEKVGTNKRKLAEV